MANFNPHQYRDSRGRFARKPSIFTRVFHTFRGFTERRTFNAQGANAAELEQKHRAELDELGKATRPRRATKPQPQGGELAEIRAAVKQMRRQLDKLEAMLDGEGDYWQAIVERPRVIISGKAAELQAFLELLGALGL